MRSEDIPVRTPDGRRVVAREAGPKGGKVVVFHTGTPGTRYLYAGCLKDGERRGLRHVCIARPGYGGSDRQPGRTLADCAVDVAAVAEALNLDSFYVVGHSGGGGHALACAACLPGRVCSVAVLSGFAPRPTSGFNWEGGFSAGNCAEFKALREGDAELRDSLESAVAEMTQIKDADQLRSQIKEDDSYCDADRTALERPLLAEHEMQSRARIARDGTDGWLDDDYALWGDSGFDLAAIDTPVTIWHGRDDRIVPVAHSEWVARNIPDARLHLLPGEGHISYFDQHYGVVLDELVELAS